MKFRRLIDTIPIEFALEEFLDTSAMHFFELQPRALHE